MRRIIGLGIRIAIVILGATGVWFLVNHIGTFLESLIEPLKYTSKPLYVIIFMIFAVLLAIIMVVAYKLLSKIGRKFEKKIVK